MINTLLLRLYVSYSENNVKYKVHKDLTLEGMRSFVAYIKKERW